ncbi:hypothetical protein PVL29_021389 [Vitis rotundifolia]|uniref:Leucine-rich repeat-containing N-terminal plant-type domain-containing protein n=1 Tax=Vitis rotundifolia TaxID=103349 RepID=A0AA38YZ94_VITRO|nr:hypothetical protein PVL29_021389 [Vitis rotundifolia]
MTIFKGIILFLLLCFLFSTIYTSSHPNTLLCNQIEKHALLSFKHALTDLGNRLSSWSAKEDCCGWNGVRCHNITGKVIELHLHNPCSSGFLEISCNLLNFSLGGKVSPALLQLEFLNYLDLSWNDFGGAPIPSFLGSMQSLRYLNLYHASFGGLIPPQLGNLSNLHSLYLGGYSSHQPQLYVENLGWISHLSSLKYLHMPEVDLHKEVHWLEFTSMLPSLSKLYLDDCNLDNMSPSLGYVNFTSLTVLHLSFNHFNHEIPNWLFNLTTSLLQLDLRYNSLKGHIPSTILELRYLNSLDLSQNQLIGQIPEHLGQLKHLEYLSLGYNSFDGPIPSSLGNLSSLISLCLHGNRLNGTLPSSLWLLSNLQTLMIGNNSLADKITEVHFNKLPKLKKLHMSSPSLIFKVKSNWVPPFQLEYLQMSSCKMGPKFPTWLQTQTSLGSLDISKSGIKDIAPTWFWKWASHIDRLIDLSDNQISGNLSGVLLNNTYIDLSSNCFTGELPRLSPQVFALKMANNSFSGSISPFLCQKLNGKSFLRILDMSTNSLSGELPHCWTYWQSLSRLNLGNNNLSGEIPDSMASLFRLTALHLNNNSLSGDIPPSLRNCIFLGLLDLGDNKFSGNIPSWMGEWTTLMVLSLRSNRLIGTIPPQICQLSSLIILDFADNSLSGTIPKCFNNFSLMTTIGTEDDAFSFFEYYSGAENYENLMLVMKGKASEYKSILKLVRTIDLSSNGLWGSIPPEISNLSRLQSLNLSFNHLVGSIPDKMGSLEALESLDLSRNHLSGEIPQSMKNLTFLNHLGLSYNNFSGRIPSSTQLQSFDALSYIGNPELCGPPLTKNCTKDEESQGMDAIDEDEEGHEMPWFYISMGLGFIVGFWGVCGALFFKKACRYAYFQFLYDVKDWVHVAIAIRWNRLRNNLRTSFIHFSYFNEKKNYLPHFKILKAKRKMMKNTNNNNLSILS